jgi:hypothetical protein
MHWGLEHSLGHYLDFWSAVLGLTLFPIGYLLHALTKRTPLTAASHGPVSRKQYRGRFNSEKSEHETHVENDGCNS